MDGGGLWGWTGPSPGALAARMGVNDLSPPYISAAGSFWIQWNRCLSQVLGGKDSLRGWMTGLNLQIGGWWLMAGTHFLGTGQLVMRRRQDNQGGRRGELQLVLAHTWLSGDHACCLVRAREESILLVSWWGPRRCGAA
jgi:hypothetical protein